MDVVIATVKCSKVIVFIDAITIFLETLKKYPRHIEEAVKLLNNTEMTIKLKKCSVFSDNINYLHHVIAPGKLHIATENTRATKTLHYLTAVLQLR